MSHNNIERFRKKLELLIAAMESKPQDEHSKLVQVVAKTLKHDYDALFPPQLWTNDNKHIYKLANHYCTTNNRLCPICTEELVARTSKYGRFQGCTNYPECKGGRSRIGKPILNEALRLFLSEKVNQAEQQDAKKHMNRFKQIMEENDNRNP